MESTWLFSLLFILFFAPGKADGIVSRLQDGPMAKTQFGPVKGIYTDEAAIFFGLPFAMTPVGDMYMRWKPPQPFNTPWSPQTYNANVPRPGCWKSSWISYK
uniref:Carboxylesterase type B domain-containing protein n=1 Tax=Branchiostoma floridae TaxID=7739 RepID=C3Y8K4_BRAFL|eukprot:XP_002607431.1 hypothetical protein BRAFLDRAFT_69856 [Branchiostoma floridae]